MVDLIVSILIVELLLRLLIYYKRKRFFILYEKILHSNKKAAYKSHPYNNYIKSPNIKNPKFPSNTHGFVGDKNYDKFKNKKVYRLIATGGSTVEQNDLDMEKPFDKNLTWPSLLEKKLNKNNEKFEVINGGCAGYTILESLISLITKYIYWKPDTIIYLVSINDILTSQMIDNFSEDYSHIRKSFDNKKASITKWIPEIRILFSYQIFLRILINFFNLNTNNLLEFISKKEKWQLNYKYTKSKKISFENYLNFFCEICKKKNIKLILIPIVYNENFEKNYNFVKEIDKIQLKKYVKFNNRIIKKTIVKYKNINLIELDKLQSKHFRKDDFIHFSKLGFEYISDEIIKNFKK